MPLKTLGEKNYHGGHSDQRLFIISCARRCVAQGYDVYAVIDASGTWNKTVQEATIQRLSQVGVKISTWT